MLVRVEWVLNLIYLNYPTYSILLGPSGAILKREN